MAQILRNVFVDNRECTAFSEKEDAEQLKYSEASLWSHSRFLISCTWVSEFYQLNIIKKNKSMKYSCLQETVSCTYNHIYQNQWKEFPGVTSTKRICHKGCTEANYWWRTETHPVPCVTSALTRIWAFRVTSFFTPLTLSSLPPWFAKASLFLILVFHHQSSHRKIFHRHKSTWPLLMLGLKLHKHYEILGERVKWIILDIFHESYILLTFFCCVFLFWAAS